jgi:hypothetical protein
VALTSILVTDLVADVRTLSGLRNNQVFTDADIRLMVLDAGEELYDDIEGSFQAYVVTAFDFTIASGAFSVALPADFKRDNSLTYLPASQSPTPVTPLGSWLERGGSNTSGLAGPYRLYYTSFFTTSGAGGTEALPVSCTPWALYLKVHASIAIRTSRQQDASDLQAKLQALKQRIAGSVKNRTQAPRQAPITRRRRINGYDTVDTSRRYWLNGSNLELYNLGGGGGNW